LCSPLPRTYLAISALVPGSWLMYWLSGKARTTKGLPWSCAPRLAMPS